MARQIIILETTDKGRLRAAFWLAVPAARQPFYANGTTVYKDATALELGALQSGAVTEQTGVFTIAGLSNAQIRTLLQGEFASRQSAVNAYNPWARFGTSWDGTTWTNGGVA